MSKSKENVFTKHPDGAKILQNLLDKKITQREASKLLGCSVPNISQIMKKYRHVPKKEERKEEITTSSIERQLEDLGILNVQLDTRVTPERYTAVAWNVILQTLMQMKDGSLEPETFIKLSNLVVKMLQFQLKEEIFPDPREQFEISKEELQQAIDEAVKEVIEDHDKWCKYRKSYVEGIDREQQQQRLVSP